MFKSNLNDKEAEKSEEVEDEEPTNQNTTPRNRKKYLLPGFTTDMPNFDRRGDSESEAEQNDGVIGSDTSDNGDNNSKSDDEDIPGDEGNEDNEDRDISDDGENEEDGEDEE